MNRRLLWLVAVAAWVASVVVIVRTDDGVGFWVGFACFCLVVAITLVDGMHDDRDRTRRGFPADEENRRGR